MYKAVLLLIMGVVLAVASSALGQALITKEHYDNGVKLVSENPNKYKISAATMYTEYEENGVAWEGKYGEGAWVLTGVIHSIGRDILGQRNVLIRAIKPYKNVDYWETIEIMYPEELPDYLKRELATYKIGQPVEIMVQIGKSPKTVDVLYYEESGKK